LSRHACFEIVGETDVGRVRTHNEDSIGWDERLGLALLADGMGGHNAGEVASRTAVDRIQAELKRSLALWGDDVHQEDALPSLASLVRTTVAKANDEIYEASVAHPEYAGMGTTVVVAVFAGHSVTVCHVGDSRLYRLRRNSLERLTEDHSLVQTLVRAGRLTEEEARVSEYRNVITRALGAAPEVEADIQQHPTEAGDVYLLCSDGLSNLVSEQQIQQTLRGSGQDTVGVARTLIRLANERGGPDNISVVLVRLLGAPETRKRTIGAARQARGDSTQDSREISCRH
jgi:serine/threonine protein phosphatase PrpC